MVNIVINNNLTGTGIYELKCIQSSKVYIGSSKNIRRRIVEHVNLLKKNKHDNNYLQKAWNKYGEKSFCFNCIEPLPKKTSKKNILKKEQYYLDVIQPWNDKIGFNINRQATQPPIKKGKKHPMYGRRHTEESKAKMRGPRPYMSATNTGKTMRERIGDPNWINPLKGKKRVGWINPCRGKKRTDWVCPFIDLKPITFKHVSGIIKTQIKKDWMKEGVRYYYLVKKNNKSKNVHTAGWYYCPVCCDNILSICKCSNIVNIYNKQQAAKQPITLKNIEGRVKTKYKREWYKLGVDVNSLVKGYQKSSKNWFYSN
jgi:group I intron endonuclease